MKVAQELFGAHRYVLSLYTAGLSVECMLRAYRRRIQEQLDERHDLNRLARTGRFFDAAPRSRLGAVGAAMGNVVTRWQNDHRFRSEESLRKFLTRKRLFRDVQGRTIKGDIVRENCRIVLDASLEIVAVGAIKWKT